MKIRSSIFAIVMAFIAGCNTVDPLESLYNADDTGTTPPVISEISPPDSSVAAIGIITITGTNFSTEPFGNQVYFSGDPGQIITATDTELSVQAPAINLNPEFGDIVDSLVVKVASRGAFVTADYDRFYTLEYPAVRVDQVPPEIGVLAIAADNSDNVYYFVGTRDLYQLAPDQSTLLLGTSPGRVLDMKMGPGGYIHFTSAKSLRRIPPAGGDNEEVAVLSGNVYCFDFDASGNILAGRVGEISSIHPDGAVQSVFADFTEFIVRLRVYDGRVFALSRYLGTDTTRALWAVLKFDITDATGSLGSPSVVFDWDAYDANAGILPSSLTFDSAGNMYITSDGNSAVTMVPGDGAGGFETGDANLLYDNLLPGPVTHVVWGGGKYLYLNRIRDSGAGIEGAIIRVNMLDARSAPYHGRGGS